jgi:hypothetical protein
VGEKGLGFRRRGGRGSDCRRQREEKGGRKENKEIEEGVMLTYRAHRHMDATWAKLANKTIDGQQ